MTRKHDNGRHETSITGAVSDMPMQSQFSLSLALRQSGDGMQLAAFVHVASENPADQNLWTVSSVDRHWMKAPGCMVNHQPR